MPIIRSTLLLYKVTFSVWTVLFSEAFLNGAVIGSFFWVYKLNHGKRFFVNFLDLGQLKPGVQSRNIVSNYRCVVSGEGEVSIPYTMQGIFHPRWKVDENAGPGIGRSFFQSWLALAFPLRFLFSSLRFSLWFPYRLFSWKTTLERAKNPNVCSILPKRGWRFWKEWRTCKKKALQLPLREGQSWRRYLR